MTNTIRVAFAFAMAAAVAFAGTAVAAGAVAPTSAENVHDGQVSPSTVEEGRSVDHTVSFHVDGVSKDGSTDRFYVEFPNDADVSVNGVTVTNRSDGSSVAIASSPELVDGPDDDGVMDTVTFAVSPSGQGERVDVNATVSATVQWPTVDEDTTADLYAAVEDSSLANVDRTSFASVTVEDTGTETGDSTESDDSTATDDSTEMDDGSDGDSGDDGSSGGSPGFGIAAVALAAALAAGLAGRRR